MDLATARGRRLMSGGTLMMLFAASMALLAIFSYAPEGAPPQEPVAVLASVGLVDDDDDTALFRTTGLVPGRSVTRCVRVAYGGPTPAGTVYFSAAQISGPLASHLNLKVEQGTGGGANSCTGFSESAMIYHGTLANLADPDPAAPRTTTGWSPQTGDERTYRFTATVADVGLAQNLASTATFRWFLVGAPPPAPEPTHPAPVPTDPAPVPTDPAPPVETPPAATEAAATEPAATELPVAPEASVDPIAAPALPPTQGTTASASPTPANSATSERRRVGDPVIVTAPPRAPDPAPDNGTAKKAKKAPIAALREKIAELGKNLTEVAVRTSSHSALPMTGVAVLLAFLTLQNRIDRLDPKLALAPMKDPHLVFNDPGADDGVPAKARPEVMT